MTKTQINLLRGRGGSNLPPSRFKKMFKPSLFVLVFAFILIGFEIAFLVTFYRQLDQKEKTLEQKNSILNTDFDSLQKEVQKLKTQKDSLDSKKELTSLVERFKSDGQNLVKILEAVSTHLPTKAWIVQLFQKDNQITVNGLAIDNESISHFLSQLKQSNHFKNVKLVIVEHEPKGGLKKFSINCGV